MNVFLWEKKKNLNLNSKSMFMANYIKIVVFGFLLWLIPFITGFLFVDSTGQFLIPETFFKSIMIVEGALIGVILAVKYFSGIGLRFVREGIILGLIWLLINLSLDLIFVFMGFFPMTVAQYVTDIGLRYLTMPICTVGMGYALEQKKPT